MKHGALTFAPTLLRHSEFLSEPQEFVYVDVNGVQQTWQLPAESLVFTSCQIPVCYRLADTASITIENCFGGTRTVAGRALSRADSQEIFSRSGEIARLIVGITRSSLCD